MKKLVVGTVAAVVIIVAGALSAEPMMDKLNAKDDAYEQQVHDWNNMGE